MSNFNFEYMGNYLQYKDSQGNKMIINGSLIEETVTGAVAEFTDGADDIPVKSLSVTLAPIQDLHGQDAPYPGGGGKNLLDVSKLNTLSLNGVTVTLDNGAMTFNGTATATAYFTISGTGFGNDTYTFSLNNSAVNTGVHCSFRSSDDQYFSDTSANEANKTVTFTNDPETIVFYIASGTTLTNFVIKPQLEKGSTATTFAPYSNICPISGRDTVTVTRAGKNLFDFTGYSDWLPGYLTVDGGINSYSTAPSWERVSPYCPMVGGKKYALSYSFSGALPSGGAPSTNLCFYDADKNFVGTRVSGGYAQLFATAPDNAAFCRFSVRTYDMAERYMLELGETVTSYEAPDIQQITIPLGQTVYGGTVNLVSGVMTVDRAMVDLGTFNYHYQSNNTRFISTTEVPNSKYATAGNVPVNAVCSALPVISTDDTIVNPSLMPLGVALGINDSTLRIRYSGITDTTEIKNTLSGVYLCYELASPVTVQLDQHTLTTLLGTNCIWSDASSVSVDYVADTKLYIQNAISDSN